MPRGPEPVVRAGAGPHDLGGDLRPSIRTGPQGPLLCAGNALEKDPRSGLESFRILQYLLCLYCGVEQSGSSSGS